MKTAFLHPAQAFNTELLQRLSAKLPGHDLLSWVTGEEAPATDLDVLLVMGKVTRAQMSRQPKLALIQTVSAGYEGVDLDAASEMGIWVSYSPSGDTGNAVSVAEFALMLMLGASRHLPQSLQPARGPSAEAPPASRALHGKTVCIAGLGGVGKLLAERLRPFGMRILATDDHPHGVPEGVTVFPTDQLKAAVRQADYLVLCVRASKDNENLVDAATLSAMKKGAILINIARGTLVDEAALFEALKSGHILAAGLDVMRVDPTDPESPLLTLPQVLITPHVAGKTDLMLDGTADYIGKLMEDFSAGIEPESLVNRPGKPRRPLHPKPSKTQSPTH